MIREVAVSLYLLVFRFVFLFFKLFPQKKKTIFLTYLGYNILHTLEAFEKISEEEMVVVINHHCRVHFENKNNRNIINLSQLSLFNWLRLVFHLATSDKVIADNYYGFLSVTDFKKNTLCVQVWHAAGAMKKFGLEDVSVYNRSNSAKKRFRNVYNRFTHVVVGSEKMAEIFSNSFGLPKEKMLKTGIPRTDFFFDENKKSEIVRSLYNQYPNLINKKVIMYAPTFRDDGMKLSKLPFSIAELRKKLSDEYIFILKVHPLVSTQFDVEDFSDFVLNLSHYDNINHLLLVTDILISDYSSIPFEFSLLEKPMIFYTYDLDEYANNRGLIQNYKLTVPGPIVKSENELIKVIVENQFDLEKVTNFKNEWNKYSIGCSSDNLALFLFKKK